MARWLVSSVSVFIFYVPVERLGFCKKDAGLTYPLPESQNESIAAFLAVLPFYEVVQLVFVIVEIELAAHLRAFEDPGFFSHRYSVFFKQSHTRPAGPCNFLP